MKFSQKLACVLFAVVPLWTYSPATAQKTAANAQWYAAQWSKIDELEKLELPRSADSVAAVIHQRAVKERHTGEAAKSFIHRQKFAKQFTENQWNQLYVAMLNEQSIAWEPYSQVLHGMMAETVQQYVSQERWRILRRQTQGDSTQLESMGVRQLMRAMAWHVDQSLLNQPLLGATMVESLPQIVEKGGKPSHLRPTLWDFLAHRAVDYFDTFVDWADLSGAPFEITEQLLEPYDKFVSLDLKADDPLDPKFRSAVLWQRIMAYRLSFGREKEALLAAELDRFLWLEERLRQPEAQVVWLERLGDLAAKAKGMPIYSLVVYHRAQTMRKPQWRDEVDLKPVVKLLEEGAAAWPKSEGGLLCKSALDDIKTPRLDLTAEENYLLGQKALFAFRFANCKQLYVQVFNQDTPRSPNIQNYNHEVDSLTKWQAAASVRRHWSVELPVYDDYRLHSAESALPELPAGQYLLVLSDKPKLQKTDCVLSVCRITVSALGVTTTQQYEKGLKVTVLNRADGAPVIGAEVIPYLRRHWDEEEPKRWRPDLKFTTDANGEVVVPVRDERGSMEIEVRVGNDVVYHGAGSVYGYDLGEGHNLRTSLFVYTDRKIYRPGQTVQFKAVLMEGDGQTAQALAAKEVSLSLRDANGNEVRQLKLTTNNFGSCSGTFRLPANVLTGNWSIVSSQGATDFSVEAYKRQKFTVSLTPPVNAYKQGDTLEVSGNAFSYSGVPLAGATVKYSVAERSAHFWRVRNTSTSEVALGSATIDDKGGFTIRFASSPTVCSRLTMPYYQVVADVTDLNGETQSATLDVAIDVRALDLSIATNAEVTLGNADSLTVRVALTNKSGQPQKGSGSYKVYRLEPLPLKPQLFWDKPEIRLAPEPLTSAYRYQNDEKYRAVPVDSGRWDNRHAEVVRLANAQWMSRGMVKLEFRADGDTLAATQTVTLHKPENGALALAEPLMLKLLADGHSNSATLLAGSAFSGFRARLEVMADGVTLVDRHIGLNNNQIVLPLPVGNYQGKTLKARIWGMGQNRFYQHDASMFVPDTTRQLRVTMETFREKLTPANTETVKLHVGTASALPAEMVTAMYDASLDVWAPNAWEMNLFYPKYYELPWMNALGFGQCYADEWSLYRVGDFPNELGFYSSFRWYDLYDGEVMPQYLISSYASMDQEPPPPLKGFGAKRMKSANAIPPPPMRGEEMLDIAADKDVEAMVGRNGMKSPTEAPLRRNLSETAFFYPQLVTDANGDVSLTYTVPESLTKWRFMALAHNTQGFSGQLTRYAQTVKELMVVPEIPRFFREGDELAITAKVVNLTDADMAARASIELIDLATQQPVPMLRGEALQTCQLKANASSVAQWWVKVPTGIEAVAVRIKAVGNEHSDGEENVVPVLPNRVMVSESMPLLLTRKGKTVHHLKSLEQATGADHHQLTFRYTQQSAWEVLKAMPFLMEYPHECSEQTFSRLFGYMVGKHMVDAYPQTKEALRYWEQQHRAGGNSLESPLMQNESLKSILLQETPWAQAGQNETANRLRLLGLLDANYTNDQIRMALAKLKEMQLGNGAFEWFKGMGGNSYITRHIMVGFGQMQRMGIAGDDNYREIVRNGVRYLHRQLDERWAALSKDSVVRNLGGDEVHLLYAASFFADEPMGASASAARDSLVARLWEQKPWGTLMEQAMAALVFHRLGLDSRASQLLASIDEKAIGRGTDMVHFRGGSSWRWTDNAVETQALVMEAVSEISPKNAMLTGMQNYLMAQKRAQSWPTTKNTVVAVGALLASSVWAAASVPDPVTVGNQRVDKLPHVKRDALSGSYAVSWNASQIKPSMGKVTVKKQADGVSWGSLHWQYFKPMSDVKAASGTVAVQKHLFVEKQTPEGTRLLPLESTTAKVGDKIVVRLSLSSSEAMDFVHVKDLRSALLEPLDVMSAYHRQSGLGYYQAVGDASVNFFIDRLPKGNFVIEYALRVRGQGITSNGFATLQCMYAPEFESRSQGAGLKTE